MLRGEMIAKSKDLRETFISDLFESLSNESKTVQLDFIYGPIIDNKFIPIDGQQRLTTLFLLHWYVMRKEGTVLWNKQKGWRNR